MEDHNEKFVDKEREHIKCCPVCTRPCAESINITNDNSFWHRCSCGVIFQDDPPDKSVYDHEYKEKYEEMKESEHRCIQAASVYCPIIEDMTMQRKILEVGCNTLDNKKYFNDRGWVYFGVDVNDDIEENNRIIKGDFECYDFGKAKFDVIWMSHVFEHFLNPVAALEKCSELLSGNGIMFIATPDTDWINTLSVSGWGHWNKKEHYIFWNLRSLTKKLEELGFDVVLRRRNFSMRYTSWHDLHIIAQKIHY